MDTHYEKLTIKVKRERVYGVDLFYPVNDGAKIAAAIINRKTIDKRSADLFRALGHIVETVNNERNL
jgi:hypothetical protein